MNSNKSKNGIENLGLRAIWLIVFLVGGYVCWQLIADIGATKLVQIGSVVIPGGTFIYAVTFTWRDLVHKRLGATWARVCIIAAAVFNIVMSLYLASIGKLAAPAFFGLDQWGAIFGLVPRIAVASIVAEVISELIDTEVYRLWVARMGERYQWARVLTSNAVSVPVDSLAFAFMAFAGVMPVAAIWHMIVGQVFWKYAVGAVSIPAIYLVRDK